MGATPKALFEMAPNVAPKVPGCGRTMADGSDQIVPFIADFGDFINRSRITANRKMVPEEASHSN